MKIQFKKVRFKCFLSYGNYWTELDLDSSAATIIRGKNGSGKSTLLSVITFALFGKAFIDVNKPDLVNDTINKDCLVEIEFNVSDKDYKIVRGIRPNIFEVWENGELLNQKSSTKDYQKILEQQIIRCNYKSFCQVVILGSASYVPFMRLTTPDRRKIIEDLLDLNTFSTMTALLKTKISELDISIKDTENDKRNLETKIQVLQKSANELKQNNEEVIATFRANKFELEKMIANSQNRIKTLSEIVDENFVEKDKIHSIEKTIQKYREFVVQARTKKSALEKEIEFLSNHDECPTCKQQIDLEFKKTTIELRQTKCEEITNAAIPVESKIKSLQEEKRELDQIIEKASFHKKEVEKENYQIQEWNRQIVKINQNIESLNQKNTNYDESEIIKLQDDLKEIEKKIVDLNSNKVHHRAALTIVPLVKGQVISKFVPIFNQQIKYYLNRFDFPIEFKINEEFEENIRIRGKDGKGYSSLSEGQKLRIDLSLLFAWRAVAKLRNSIDSSILVLDEILDSSLDDEGIEVLGEIVKTMDSNVIIISHKDTDVYRDVFDRVINVTQKANFSRMVLV